MRESTIARNYAEALFQAGENAGRTEAYADLIEGVAGAMSADETIRNVLESPRVSKPTKRMILERALQDRAPEEFIRFLGAVVKRGRQGIIPVISDEYLLLVDQKFNRVHAGVTLAREPDKRLQKEIKKRLANILGQEVLPHFHINSGIIGGLIVRVGDRLMDGSIRRKLMVLRRHMLGA